MTSERWKRLDALFHEALELGGEARVAFLVEACGGDEQLREEVEKLIAAHERKSSFIDSPIFEQTVEPADDDRSKSPVGRRIGPYQIIRQLGRGGMGEVYCALDTRLGREVAIKLLPAAFSTDHDRLRRFEQEARAAGMLNHPNVLTIYDIGTTSQELGGAPYIVSELLTGETLRERLRREALSLRCVVDHALQIAHGLQAAHEKGIVHRDLKPENLFLTKDGRIKILDFGLAKLKPAPTGIDEHASTQPLGTAPGVVMGTVGYMSPEQVRAEEVDHRSDIFAFGAILYEMLCGRRAFQGGTAVELMNAILKEEPPEITESAREVPAALQRVMRHCLEKDPAERFQSINDVAFYLDALSEVSDSTSASQARVSGQPKSYQRLGQRFGQHLGQRLGWIVAAFLLLVTIALFVYLHREPAEVAAVRFSVPPPEKATSFRNPTISPDGSRLAFTATIEGKTLLWVRPLDSLVAQPLPGTEGASFPFWSPTSEFIGFFAQGKLKKIALSGGPPTTLCDAPFGKGGTWNRDGVILFTPTESSGVYRVSAEGGAAAVVTTPDSSRQENAHYWPSFLPNGRHFLYLMFSSQPEEIGIYLASLDGGERKRLAPADANAVYAASAVGGYLLFVREGTLLAQPFDATARRLTGEPFRLADQVQVNFLSEAGAFSASENGVLVYSTNASGWGGRQQLCWFDRTGKPLGVIGSPGMDLIPALSPDEKRVAVSRLDPQTRNADIWLLDLARGTESRFTYDPATDHTPVWAPDGSRIVWNSNREGLANLYHKVSSGAGQDELLLQADNWKWANDWSRDGRFIVYGENHPKTKANLWILPFDGERQPFPYLQTPFDEFHGCFSPDSKWIAYTSNESGSNEVYVQAFPATGDKWRISTNGGFSALWRRDGKELFYFADDGKLMVVKVKSGATFEAGAPQALFDLHSIREAGGRNYAVTGDGQRFLIVTRLKETNTEPFTAMLNWTAGLSRPR